MMAIRSIARIIGWTTLGVFAACVVALVGSTAVIAANAPPASPPAAYVAPASLPDSSSGSVLVSVRVTDGISLSWGDDQSAVADIAGVHEYAAITQTVRQDGDVITIEQIATTVIGSPPIV